MSCVLGSRSSTDPVLNWLMTTAMPGDLAVHGANDLLPGTTPRRWRPDGWNHERHSTAVEGGSRHDAPRRFRNPVTRSQWEPDHREPNERQSHSNESLLRSLLPPDANQGSTRLLRGPARATHRSAGRPLRWQTDSHLGPVTGTAGDCLRTNPVTPAPTGTAPVAVSGARADAYRAGQLHVQSWSDAPAPRRTGRPGPPDYR
jgi:hypothetical protein